MHMYDNVIAFQNWLTSQLFSLHLKLSPNLLHHGIFDFLKPLTHMSTYSLWISANRTFNDRDNKKVVL